MDTELRAQVSSGKQAEPEAASAEELAQASAIIGSDAFVERVLRAMAVGARQAIEENAALERRPEKP
ncbi:MAG TPA: hypothetical protein VGG99_12540 [Acetobacteraceae bacterium]|jgi:hypothetical protein